MITKKLGPVGGTVPYEVYGKSTDTKPTDVPNGSIFIEMDTSKIYFFNENEAEWLAWGV